MCIRLNELALPGLLAIEASEGHIPRHVPLAWMAMTKSGIAGLALDDLLARRPGTDLERYLRDEIFSTHVDWWPTPISRAFGRYTLSQYLSQLMMHAVSQLARPGGRGGQAYLGVTDAVAQSRTPGSVDSRYLATLVLTFIVLHELGHFLLGHNERPAQSPNKLGWGPC